MTRNLILFLTTVLIWGTTWLAIAVEIGPVPILVSVFYRFALAGCVFIAVLAIFKRLTVPALRQQPFIIAQALCLFSCNFLCFYSAAQYLPSGLISVIFSLATLYNAINARIFFGDRISARVLLAAAFGTLGLVLLFGPSAITHLDSQTLKGVGLAALGTLFFSLGNMVSRRNSLDGISPVTANAWGMAYGGALLLLMIWITGTEIVLPPDAKYVWALIYLAVIGSVIGFTTYLTLVARIGSAKAAYATVLFPVVALALSTMFEGYHWSFLRLCGLALTLIGNVVIFTKPKSTVISGQRLS